MSSTPMKSTANPFGIETDTQCRTSLEQDGSGGEAYAGTFSGLVRIGGRRDRVEKKHSFQWNTKVLRQLFLGNGSVQKQSFPDGQGDSSGPPFPTTATASIMSTLCWGLAK